MDSKGERRPADVISNAVKVMKIATGEEPEDFGPADDGKDPAAKALGTVNASIAERTNCGENLAE